MNALVRASQVEVLEGEVLPPCITVRCWRNPFSSKFDTHEILGRKSIQEIVEQSVYLKHIAKHSRVWVAHRGRIEEVPQDQWSRVTPREGAEVVIKVTPFGGGGGKKNFLAVILTILVIVVAWYAAPAVAGAMGVTPQVAFSALSTIGKALVSALIPPPKSNTSNGQISTEKTFSLTGVSNRAAPFEAVPRAYGAMRYFPPLASAPYNEVVGTQDVYLRMLFDFGPGPLKISELKIGDSPIELFNNWQVEVGHTGDLSGASPAAGTYYAGFTDDRDLTLYPTAVIQTQENVHFIRHTDITRSFHPKVQQGLVVLSFPRGLIAFSNAQSNPGGRGVYQTVVGCWYREVGSPTWIPMMPMDSFSILTANGSYPIADDVSDSWPAITVPANWSDTNYLAANPDVSSNYHPSGVTLRGWDHYYKIGSQEGRAPAWVNGSTAMFPIEEMIDRLFYYTFKTPKLDVTKDYEYRVYRPYGTQTPGSSKISIVDEWWLSSAQSFKADKPVKSVTGHALMALRIKASDQLNGTLQNFSAKVEAVLPAWNGSSWNTPAITRSPAWAALDVLRGSANARPIADSRIDLATWKAFADWCAGNNSKGNPRAMFDGVFDAKTTVFEALHQILSPQRAAFTMKDGKYSVIWDDVKTTPVQMFTPKNSQAFQGEKIYITPPHALKIRFNNELKGYLEDELTVYADGYNEGNSNVFEQLEAFGIVRAEQAHWFGRYMMATALLRPETYNLDVDIEGLVCRRGDLVRVQHDITRWGIASGRVKSITTSGGNVLTITLDETFLMEAGKAYSIRGRLAAGTIVVAAVNGVASPTETQTVTLTSPVAQASMVDVGDLVAFGETSKETVSLLIRSIKRKDDLHASLELVDYSPDIFISDTESIPSFSTQSTWQGAGIIQSPPVPVISKIVSDESAMVSTSNGYVEAIEVYLQSPSSVQVGVARPDDYIEVRYRAARSVSVVVGGMTLDAGVGSWYSPTKKFFGNPGVVRISDNVRTNDEFDIQVRRVSSIGNASDWCAVVRHTVIGRSTPPAAVLGFTAQVRADDILLFWTRAPEKDILGYELRIGSNWSSASTLEGGKAPTTQTTQYVLPPQTSGSITVLCRALDTFGLYSATDSSVVVSVLAPSTPSASYTFQGNNLVLTWQDCQTSHRIALYKVKRGTDAPVEINTTSIQFPLNWAGALAFQVWAVDIAGNESVRQSLSITSAGASAPANFLSAIVGDAVQFSWTSAAAGSVPVASYELRYGGTSWADASLAGSVNGTSFLTSASWSGSRTWRIKAIDSAGNYGAESTRVVNITVPATVVATPVVSAGNYSMSWPAVSSMLPVKEYEIRYGASWAAGTLVATIQALNWSAPVTWVGTRSFWIVARTTTALESSPAQVDVAITVPVAPSITTAFIASTVSLSWGVPSGALPIARYEVRQGGTQWSDATFVSFTDTTIFSTPVNWSGTRTYRVAAIDTGGNVGSAAAADVTVTAPIAPTPIAADIVDNNVLLRWSVPSIHTLPIDHYEVRVGATWAGATSLGNKDGTFTSHFQTQAGTYTYWVAAFDSAGNIGSPASLAVTVSQPPDYVLKTNYVSSFGGTLTNAVVADGAVYMPVVTGETFQQHFDNNTWASPQDQVNASFPIVIEPTTTSPATYVETYDYGASIPSANINLTATYTTVNGTIAWTGRIEVSSNNSTWTDVANPGWVGLASNFRYVRFTVKAVGTDRTAVGVLSSVNLRIDLKQVTDSGVKTCNSGDAGGTTVTFGRTFLDVDSIVLTPRSTTACYAVVDFTDVANPTTFKILVFDTNGNRVTKDVGWEARGV